MTTETTAVTVIERAAVALGSSKAETELTALAAKSKDITTITNSAGREECHAAAMVARSARIAIEKTAKTAREDATAFSRAVIAEGSRLVALIEPEESRLITLRNAWDAAEEAKKAAKAEEERLALAAIKTRIDNIKAWPVDCATASPESILDEIKQLEHLEVDDSFGASYGEAVEAKAERAAEEQRLADARAEIAAAQRALDEAKAEALNQANAIAREAQAAEAARIAAQAAAAQKVIDDAAAEVKRAADEAAAQQLHEMAQQQAEQRKDEAVAPVTPIRDDDRQAMLNEAGALSEMMNTRELLMFIHYGERLIQERQVAA